MRSCQTLVPLLLVVACTMDNPAFQLTTADATGTTSTSTSTSTSLATTTTSSTSATLTDSSSTSATTEGLETSSSSSSSDSLGSTSLGSSSTSDTQGGEPEALLITNMNSVEDLENPIVGVGGAMTFEMSPGGGDFTESPFEFAARFNMTQEYVSYPIVDGDHEHLLLEHGELSMWVKPLLANQQPVANMHLFGTTWDGGRGMRIHVDQEGAFVVSFRAIDVPIASTVVDSGEVKLTNDVWTEIVVAWDFTVDEGAQNVLIWFDGFPVETYVEDSKGPMVFADTFGDRLYVGSWYDSDNAGGRVAVDELTILD